MQRCGPVRQQQLQRLADDFRGGVAKRLLGGAIKYDYALIGVDGDHRVFGSLEDPCKSSRKRTQFVGNLHRQIPMKAQAGRYNDSPRRNMTDRRASACPYSDEGFDAEVRLTTPPPRAASCAVPYLREPRVCRCAAGRVPVRRAFLFPA